MDDMRKSSAVVIHVGSEAELLDKNGKGWPMNPNVLIEIGAAMMHCPDQFVLVVENGVELPSNLQGLYQCRYTGDGLDFDAVMKIQEALKGLKWNPMDRKTRSSSRAFSLAPVVDHEIGPTSALYAGAFDIVPRMLQLLGAAPGLE